MCRGQYLGKGGFAICYELKDVESHETFAAKVISKKRLIKSRAREKLLTEIRIHRSLHHRHVVKFERFFEDDKNVYLLLELCEAATLAAELSKRKRMSEAQAGSYIYQIVDALVYMHQQQLVIHRDLKLGNLFLQSVTEVKIGKIP